MSLDFCIPSFEMVAENSHYDEENSWHQQYRFY